MSERRVRGRPRSFDKDEVLQVILGEFWTRGFAATSLDDLSAATGLSRPSLYSAYGDKSAMYGAALEAFGGIMERQAVPALQNEPDLRAALTGFYEGALDVYFSGDQQARGCMVFTMAVADATLDSVALQAVQQFLGKLDGAIGVCLERLAPQLGADERNRLAQIGGGMLMNLATRARSGAPRVELEALARVSSDLMVQAARIQ